jgi:NTP pyrophosphatase (non-canonical NTP hydrolase)
VPFTTSGYRDLTVDEWQGAFAEVYGHIDSKRRPTEVWLLLVEDASKVAEAVRTNRYEDALDPLAHVMCWTASFATRCETDSDLGVEFETSLLDMVWHKYPGVCSHCADTRCFCSIERATLEEMTPEEKQAHRDKADHRLRAHRKQHKNKPQKVDELQAMFQSIYEGAHYSYTVGSLAFHFMEEVGEVATCIRKLREADEALHNPRLKQDERKRWKAAQQEQFQEIQDELADVVSWSFSLIQKLDFLLGAGMRLARARDGGRARLGKAQTAHLTMSEVLWHAYRAPNGRGIACPVCGARRCKCSAIKL